MLISRPVACKERIAASLPEPGPFTTHSTVFIPCSIASFAAVSAASWAAKGVLFLEPLKPEAPALDQEIALPDLSVITIMVLRRIQYSFFLFFCEFVFLP